MSKPGFTTAAIVVVLLMVTSAAFAGESLTTAWENIRTENGLPYVRSMAMSWDSPEPGVILLQNYPNPFNPETWIPYRLTQEAEVTITIYNLNGRQIRRLELGFKAPGLYIDKARSAYWDGIDSSGEPVSSGIYFYRMEAGGFSAIQKMIMVQ